MSFDFRRYFESGATETPAASIDIAAIMAKSGAKTDNNPSATVPEINTEEAKQPTEAESKTEVKVETTTKPTTSEPVAEATAPPSQTQGAALPSSVDWKLELKRANKAEILKELGYDEKMVGFFNKWSTDGDVTAYLKAVTVDYTKMSPEQLMRYQLQEEFPEFSPEDLDELYAAKVIEHYKLDPEVNSETEIKRGKLVLAADAKKVREGLVAKQQEYILNAKPPAAAPDESALRAKQQEIEQQEYMDRYNTSLRGNQITKDLLTNKLLSVGEGENVFNYEVPEPEQLIQLLQNPQEYVKHVFDQEGKPNVARQLFIAAAAKDHVKLATELIKFGRSLGAKQALEEIENAKKPEPSTAKPETPLSPVQALAKHGIMTSSE